MIYEVRFADGTIGQVSASNDSSARQLAVTKFKEKVVIEVRKAGLLGMSQRPTPKYSDHG
jgi:hypothetical protein